MNHRSLAQAKFLRKAMTPAEKLLWRKLRAKRFHGCKFKRQVPVGNYIADFCSFDHRMIIEIDGSVHLLKVERDHKRESFLQHQGFRILRFANQRILASMNDVLQEIAYALFCPLPMRGEG